MTPPAPTLAPGRERVSVDAEAFAVLEAAFQRAAGAGSDWEWKAEAVDELLWPAYDAMQATARPLPAAPVAGVYGQQIDAINRTLSGSATPAAPVAGTFVEAVDALDKAAYAVAAWDAGGPSALGDPTHHRHAARLALMDAHAADVARVTAERDELREMLADRNALATDFAMVTAERDAAMRAVESVRWAGNRMAAWLHERRDVPSAVLEAAAHWRADTSTAPPAADGAER